MIVCSSISTVNMINSPTCRAELCDIQSLCRCACVVAPLTINALLSDLSTSVWRPLLSTRRSGCIAAQRSPHAPQGIDIVLYHKTFSKIGLSFHQLSGKVHGESRSDDGHWCVWLPDCSGQGQGWHWTDISRSPRASMPWMNNLTIIVFAAHCKVFWTLNISTVSWMRC